MPRGLAASAWHLFAVFVGSGYLTQKPLDRLVLLLTRFFLAAFMTVGTAWRLLVSGRRPRRDGSPARRVILAATVR